MLIILIYDDWLNSYSSSGRLWLPFMVINYSGAAFCQSFFSTYPPLDDYSFPRRTLHLANFIHGWVVSMLTAYSLSFFFVLLLWLWCIICYLFIVFSKLFIENVTCLFVVFCCPLAKCFEPTFLYTVTKNNRWLPAVLNCI